MTNKTTALKEKKPRWHFLDASNQVLGRFATDIAGKLMGKNKADFSYRVNNGDKVVVTNAAKIRVTGKKLKDKIYYKHTEYPGNLREESLGKLLARKPEEVIKRAVKGMLPKNKLQQERLNNLYIYAGPEHPHQGQENGQN